MTLPTKEELDEMERLVNTAWCTGDAGPFSHCQLDREQSLRIIALARHALELRERLRKIFDGEDLDDELNNLITLDETERDVVIHLTQEQTRKLLELFHE